MAGGTNGLAPSAQTIHTSSEASKGSAPRHIFTHAAKLGDKISDVRAGGHAVELLYGEYSL